MFKYAIKRLLLMIPVFLGATLLVFLILSFVPGGPFERAVMQLKAEQMSGGGEAGGGGGSSQLGSNKLTEDQLDQLKRQYGLDKPVLVRYLVWLGVWPREVKSKKVTVGQTFRENVEYVQMGGRTFELQKWIKVEDKGGQIVISESGIGADFKFNDEYGELPNASQITNWYENDSWEIKEQKNGRLRLAQTAFSGIFTGDLGVSYNYSKPVTTLIMERLHISAYFGMIGFFLTYLICIPLGITKAVRHNSKFDLLTSGLIFMGYATPGFALGALLLVLFGGGSFWDIFPLGGFRSPNFEELSFMEKVWDQIHHTFLPVIAYMVGAFANLTILMKNSLMENLNQDYVRTAFAKGLDDRTAIYKHAVRNSLIPIATGLGRFIGIFLAGSYLVELVFNIDGIGLLSYKSVVNVDYPVFLGFLVINVVILLIGNLLSDFFYVLIDPRIKFD